MNTPVRADPPAKGSISILVTGAGAPLGVSIMKAARQSPLQPRIVATDCDPLSVGLFRADAGHVLPHVTDDLDGYVDRLRRVIATEDVRLVCFGSEIEMEKVAPLVAEIERDTGARLVANGPAVLSEISDKLRLVQALQSRGIPCPETAAADDPEAVEALLSAHGFPVIVKPRHGSGSQRVSVVTSRRELETTLTLIDQAVVQELLTPADQEHTVGLYVSSSSGYLGQISLRRTLAAGNTYKAQVVEDPEIEALCRTFCERVDVWGPVNLQLRKTERGARIFEVNLRFSASAVMRAHFGFNEADLAMRDLLLGERLERPIIRPGVALRYWDEIYLTAEEVQAGTSVSGQRGTRQDLL